MRILVSGATSYLGLRLIARLTARGDEVHALVRPSSARDRLAPLLPVERVHAAQASPLEGAVVTRLRPEAVCHLAASGAGDRSADAIPSMIEANLLLGTLLAGLSADLGVRRFIQAGTCWDRGLDGCPADLHAATKRGFETILDYYRARCGLDALVLRLFGVYGPRDWRPKLLRRLRESRTSPLPVPFRGGGQRIDMIHVDDVVSAFVAALDLPPGLPRDTLPRYDVGSGTLHRVRDIAETYQRLAGVPLNIGWGQLPDRQADLEELVAAPEPARRDLGWSPTLTLEAGLRAVLEEEACP